MRGLIKAEGRRDNAGKDTEHIASSGIGRSLRSTEAKGWGQEIGLFLEYADVFDCMTIRKYQY